MTYASSAQSADGNRRGSFLRLKGTGAPTGQFGRALALLALAIAALFATAAPAGASETGTVSDVSYTTAKVTGKASASGFFTVWSFEVSTDKTNPSGWTASPGANGYIINGTGNVPVNAELTELRGGTKYFARLVVNGTPTGEPYPEFTTLPVDPPAIVAVDNASGVFSTSAQATGKVKRPANADPAFNVKCRFEYVSDSQFTATGFQNAAQAGCKQNPITPAKAGAGGETNVSAELGGTGGPSLTPSTTYHLRLVAENAAPGVVIKDAPSTFTTAAKVAKPTVVAINDATDLVSRGNSSYVKVSGEVERPAGPDPALDTNCRFEYITDAQFKVNGFIGAEVLDCGIAIKSGDPASAKVKGELFLSTSTTYHLRLVAENGGGVDTKEGNTFTTPPPRLPIPTIDKPKVEYNTAEVSGTIKPEGCGLYGYIYYYFQYSTEPSNPDSWVNSELVGDNGVIPDCETTTPVTVGGTITGLQSATTYSFRLWVSTFDTTVFSSEPSATTKFVNKPTITLAVEDVTLDSAHFAGSVQTNAPPGPLDPATKEAYKTTWHVVCEPKCPTVADEFVIPGDQPSGLVSLDPIRLETNTYYEVELIAINGSGTTVGTASFSTPHILAGVRATPGGSAGKGAYNIGGLVTPYNTRIEDCHFEYGPTTEYVYRAPCSPNPTGRNEVQKILMNNIGGIGADFFKLSFRGQTTEEMSTAVPSSVVEEELKALSSIGPAGVSVKTLLGDGFFHIVEFTGPLAATNVGQIRIPYARIIGEPPHDAGLAQNFIDGGNNNPVVVETHLTGLTPGATYHYQVVATNDLGTSRSDDSQFVAPPAADEAACPNEDARIENSSARLPECRAYELVTTAFKQSSAALLARMSIDPGAISYTSRAGNINNSGYGGIFGNNYVAFRHDDGWETTKDMNGPRGSFFAPPTPAGAGFASPFQYSTDLKRSLWFLDTPEYAGYSWAFGGNAMFLRGNDGRFTLVSPNSPQAVATGPLYTASEDLSHIFYMGLARDNGVDPEYVFGPGLGPGIYEYVGTNNGPTPRRIDVLDSGEPISECLFSFAGGGGEFIGAVATISTGDARSPATPDGSTVYFNVDACKDKPEQVWARVDASKSYFASKSQCTRTASDPGGACGAPADASLIAGTADGRAIVFETKQQLLNNDTDNTNDVYEYILPTASDPNPSPNLFRVSGPGNDAKVERVIRVSMDGRRVYFQARSVLASNHDPFDRPPHLGDLNFYVWQQSAANPEGKTTFITRLDAGYNTEYMSERAQSTDDGRYFVFLSDHPLTDSDTDTSADVYRYDAVTGVMTRISVDASGLGGNAEGKDANIYLAFPRRHDSVSNDGQQVVFVTPEALSPDDGNGGYDAYLWQKGHTSLISTGAVGGGAGAVVIHPSGDDIYFDSPQQLTANDIDDVVDVYDARRNGGFSFQRVPPCSGEGCQPAGTTPPETVAPASDGGGEGNYVPAAVSIKPMSTSQRAKLAAGGEAELALKVSGPGAISLKGNARIGKRSPEVIAVTSRAVQAGVVNVPITLSKSGLSRLRSRGSLSLRLSAVLADSDPATATLKLKSAEARRKRSKKGSG